MKKVFFAALTALISTTGAMAQNKTFNYNVHQVSYNLL